ncbi:MAG: LacI family DNA-binding transcriptional regulator [Sphaerochaetaceae bacterium]|nr:LacI family DNA-binding transcriptional regulator [Sphaerochaetaceae bacterium]
MANIKQVAKLAELSVSCVSKYLKDPSSVLPSSREKIEEAVKELQYVPSTVARNLRNQRTGIIKIITHSITNQFFAEFFESLRTELEKSDYIGSLQTLSHHENRLFSVRDFEQIDGVILCFIENHKTLDSIAKNIPSSMPMINIHGEKGSHGFPSILTDVRQGSYEATCHLIAQGGTHLAYIGGYADNTVSSLKKSGFMQAVEDRMDITGPLYSCDNEFSMQAGFDAAKRLFGHDNSIDAIFCENDLLAAGAIHYLHDSSRKIPEEVRVIGYDNIPLASMFIPPISSVSIPVKEMSVAAVSKLLDLLQSKEAEDVRFVPRLYIRSST